jgi:hypothetical protein
VNVSCRRAGERVLGKRTLILHHEAVLMHAVTI